MTALSTSGISRPFDVRRDGFVIAEGAAALVLEDKERAARPRGPHLRGDRRRRLHRRRPPHHGPRAPRAPGRSPAWSWRWRTPGSPPGDVGHINAHGTSTPLNDLAEARAIHKVFGDPGPPVTSAKGLTGHSLGAAGAIEAVASALTIFHGVDPADRRPRGARPRDRPRRGGGRRPGLRRPGPVLSNSFGFGGHNGCLVLVPAG